MKNSREIWKDIIDYENLYQVSNYGRVKSLRRKVFNGKDFYYKEERILKANTDGRYLCLTLVKNGRRKSFKIHRLVAEAFIPNPNNYPEVNHKDENKLNNCVNNLEWCSRRYNNIYNGRAKKVGLKTRKPVIQYDLKGNYLNLFPSVRIASEKTKINASVIIRKCKDINYNNQDGFIWKYLERKNYE